MEADRPHPRATLACLLWPERSDCDALANLRYALSNLRQAIGDRATDPPLLLITHDTLQFNALSDHRLDVAAFEALIGQGDPNVLQATVDLCPGDFLEGFSVSDSAPFEEWLTLKREQVNRRMFWALHSLADHFERQGEYEQARHYAQRQVEREPWQEEAHQQLMRVLALGGHRAAALAQFETCRRVLAAELDVVPARETVLLYEAIRDGKLIAPHLAATPAAHSGATGGEPAEPLCVARERELERLSGFLDKALAGAGRVAFVIGEAGSGKTVLLDEFARRSLAAHADLLVADGRCNAYTGYGDPYLPFLEVLHLLTGDLEDEPAAGMIPQKGARRLYSALPDTAQALLDHGPDLIDRFVPGAVLMARLQALGRGPAARLEALLRRHETQPTASVQQSDLFGQFTKALQALSHLHPLLLVLDDLQWADAGSIALLFHLARRLAGQHILIVGAYRPDDLAAGRDGERHPLEAVIHELQRDYGAIHVDLSQSDGRQFVEALLDTEPNRLEPAFGQMLYQHTEGHPLFTVEFLRGLQERGDLIQDDAGRWAVSATLDWETLPPRVEAVIAERIGRLPERWQTLLATASVEGETFSAEILARALGADEPEIAKCLSGPLEHKHRLVFAQGVERFGEQRLSRYRFRHDLFQRYLYGRLDVVERACLHETVADELEARCGQEADDLAVRLAWHCESAGMAEKALNYLQRAGDRAERLSAPQEAISHYQHALELLATLPQTDERSGQQISLLISLGQQLLVCKGHAHPEVQRTFDRARSLCRQIGAPQQLIPALYGLSLYYSIRTEYGVTRELYAEILATAKRTGDPVLVATANRGLGYLATVTGEFAPARAYLEQALNECDPERVQNWLLKHPHDHAVASHGWLSWALWLLGYRKQSLNHTRQALALAEVKAQPFDVAFALMLAFTLASWDRDVEACQVKAEVALGISTDKGFPLWEALGHVYRGWALAQQGMMAIGLAELRGGVESIRVSGALQCYPFSLLRLAEALGLAGQTDEGFEVVDKALAEERRTGSRAVMPELLRLRGELLNQHEGNQAVAEACFLQAIAVAQDQQAKSWELRATLSLYRLWQRMGRGEEAHARLAAVYGWFTEGFDAPDLREAKALLSESDVSNGLKQIDAARND